MSHTDGSQVQLRCQSSCASPIHCFQCQTACAWDEEQQGHGGLERMQESDQQHMRLKRSCEVQAQGLLQVLALAELVAAAARGHHPTQLPDAQPDEA